MFWVDAELGVDIYLDGKLKQIFFCFQVKCYGLDFFFHSHYNFNLRIVTLFKLV